MCPVVVQYCKTTCRVCPPKQLRMLLGLHYCMMHVWYVAMQHAGARQMGEGRGPGKGKNDPPPPFRL